MSQTRNSIPVFSRLPGPAGLCIAAFLLLATPTSDAGVQGVTESASETSSDRVEAGRRLLDGGVEALSAFLDGLGVPRLTFDQESQIRLLRDTYVRQRADLITEGNDPEAVDISLAEQLILAAARFLNPVQRNALGGFAAAEINTDLPQDEAELREYLRDLTNPLSGGGDGNGGGFGGGGNDGVVIDGFSGGRMPTRDEIAEIRINDNAFTAAQNSPGRGQTEIITRGGTGDFNGDFTFEFQDESLDARNAFADARPPYQTREFEVNLSAPVIRDRLTLTGSFVSDTSEEGDTLRAETPSGLISQAITRPGIERGVTTRATAQLHEDHAMTFSFDYQSEEERNQGVGGFDLPEQGSTNDGSQYNFQAKETAILSPSLSNEVRFRYQKESEESVPNLIAPRIDVSGAFVGGGSTDRGSSEDTEIEVGDLLMYTGETVSIQTGFDGYYSREHSESFENFNGTFEFASLEDFIAGEPTVYEVNLGEPLLDVDQVSGAGYFQSDFRLTPQLTMGLGARYQAQSDIGDWNNIDPRVGLAYHLGGTTVIRGGSGIYHDTVPVFLLQDAIRFDGERQQTLTIRNPSYPDPFQEGDQTIDVPSSVRVIDDDIAAPYSWHNEWSIETTLPFGLQVTGAYRYVRGVHLLRGRNLNAPRDIRVSVPESCKPGQDPSTCVRPQPDRGDILQLESTGTSRSHEFRVGFQQRFSFLNLRGDYALQSAYSDVPDFGFQLPADNHNLDLEWGPDQALHQVDLSVNVRLGWNVDADAQFNWSSGEPYSLETGDDDNQDANRNDRPPGVFRNSLTGPSTYGLDLNLSKTFILIPEAGSGLDPVGGGGYFGRRSGLRMTIEARADNVLNQTRVTRLSGVQTSPFFREPIDVADARQISLSMRVDF